MFLINREDYILFIYNPQNEMCEGYKTKRAELYTK